MKHLHAMTRPAPAQSRLDQGPFLDVLGQLLQLVLAIAKLALSGNDEKNFAF